MREESSEKETGMLPEASVTKDRRFFSFADEADSFRFPQ